MTANAYGIYYNKDKFKELGLEVPTTYAEFVALVDKIKADGSAAPFALSLNDAWSLNGYHQLAWVTVAGGFDGAEDILIRSAKGAIQNDATTKAVLERLQLLKDNGQKGQQARSMQMRWQLCSRRCSHASTRYMGSYSR